MPHCLRLLTLTSLLLLSACSRSPEEQALHDTAEHAILPMHENFLAESHALSQAAQAFCELDQRSTAALAAMKDRWVATSNAWEGIQAFQFGPVTVDNQAWKIQFWPDQKNLVARKTEQWIGSETAISQQSLSQASVVIQGLSAMEYLLYDKPANRLLQHDAPRYCQQLVAIAENTEQVANRLYQGWHPKGDNYLARFTEPGPENLEFPDQNASIAAVIETLVYGLERIKRDKLERPLALKEQSGANIYLLEWWRSQQSLNAIVVNLQSLKALYNARQQGGLDTLLRQQNAAELADTISLQFDRAISYAESIEGSLEETHADPETQLSVMALYGTLSELLTGLKKQLPSSLGLSLGFNANDGD